MAEIQIGQQMPRFMLQDQYEEFIFSEDFIGTGPTVIFFYPKAFSPGCTMEVCGFRDTHLFFLQSGARVLGISPDPVEKQRRFSQRYGLPFTLLSDAQFAVSEMFGVGEGMLRLPNRTTYIFDRSGILRHKLMSNMKVKAHLDEAYLAIQRLMIDNLRAS
jgi:thioredoxin-dependent peroxiredoxin